MSTPARGYSRFTVDLPTDVHRALKRYAFETDVAAAEVVRSVLRDFLAAKRAGDAAVEAALYRRGYQAGEYAERERIARAVNQVHTGGGRLPTRPPEQIEQAE